MWRARLRGGCAAGVCGPHGNARSPRGRLAGDRALLALSVHTQCVVPRTTVGEGVEMSKFSSFARVTTLAALTTIAQPAAAAVTPFGQRVNDAIERGLEYLRQNQGGDGGIDDGEGGGTTGLAMLCFLEKRSGVDWNAPHLGYAGMDAADQDRVRRGINYCLSNVPGFTGDTPYSYSTGACLMAASLYLVTGGPDDVGAPLPVSQAVANAVNGLRGTQGNGGCNEGGWNYRGPQDSGACPPRSSRWRASRPPRPCVQTRPLRCPTRCSSSLMQKMATAVTSTAAARAMRRRPR